MCVCVMRLNRDSYVFVCLRLAVCLGFCLCGQTLGEKGPAKGHVNLLVPGELRLERGGVAGDNLALGILSDLDYILSYREKGYSWNFRNCFQENL